MKDLLWLRSLYSVLLVLFGIFILYALVKHGYDQTWTGFQGYTNSKGECVPPKKLWDWLQLLIVPAMIAVGVWWLNKSQRRSEQRIKISQEESQQQIETDKQRQKALEDYFECMTDLLLNHKLRDGNQNSREARSIARTRTLAVLRILDGERKAQALQFLYESGLISAVPVISLNGADFSNSNLNGANLREAEIKGAHFKNAHLKCAHLDKALLSGSNFSGADLTGASMNNTDLQQATLNGADLRKTSLRNAILREATVRNARLSEADFQGADLEWVDFRGADLKGTRNFPKGD